ncbi:hypothetical protein QYE76_021457 [Lolium multiflorum]|uniref:Transposase (putative) gypsy type domain-containing protein n=1 Tax=Lolium multiflorum TaxID=4521 RepID=A0AAD8R818_LOLMU|nr:hypothetical protein QYE76_021457 [Lolium multiflorum]
MRADVDVHLVAAPRPGGRRTVAGDETERRSAQVLVAAMNQRGGGSTEGTLSMLVKTAQPEELGNGGELRRRRRPVTGKTGSVLWIGAVPACVHWAEQFLLFPFFAFIPILRALRALRRSFPRRRRSPPEPCSRRTCAVLPTAVKLFTAPSLCGASSSLLSQAFFAGLRRSPSPAAVDGQEFASPPATFFINLSAASDTGVHLIPMSSEQHLSESSSDSRESSASGEPQMEIDAGASQDAGSSSQASEVNLSGVTRGAWKGSEVSEYEIDWLYRSRRIPKGVSCRRPGDEIEPDPEDGEFVVFLAHFERGFGLPASDFFRQFLDFYKLQPHHLPGNAIFYLSCYATYMEAYMGLRPTRETFARFYSLRINSVQGKNIPKPKPPDQCGTFFYVKNTSRTDLINLPAFDPAVPTSANWSFNPKGTHNETNRIIRFMKQLMKDTAFCPDDIVWTFISRRVLPLHCRAHKMSEMYGPDDPTKITGLPLSKEDVVLKARHICQTSMTPDWEWGLLPLSTLNPPSEEAKLRFPRIDVDRRGICRFRTRLTRILISTGPTSRWAGSPFLAPKLPQPAPTRRSTSMRFRCRPRSAMFLEKLTSQDKKRKDPEPDADPSAAPPAKRPKKPSKRHYVRREMPTSDGPALKVSKSASGMPPESSEDPVRSSPPPRQSPVPSGPGNSSASPLGGSTSAGRAAPKSPDHRAEEDLVSPPVNEDIGANNTGAEPEDVGPVGTLVPTAPKKKKKNSASSSSRSLPAASAPAKTLTAPGAPKATLMPPPAGDGFWPAAPGVVAREKATGLLGRITELKREGRELGHLLDYAEKWNLADVSTATRGVGRDRLPIVDPAGPKSTEEHFMRLKRAVREFDNAWQDATSNVVSTADAQKQLFKELLWEHRDLAEAHSHCQVIPEASIEALKTQLSDLHVEKEQLLQTQQEALDAQKEISRQLKDQAMQAGLRHDEEMRDAKAAAEAKLAEVLEESSNANTVLLAELEEERKAQKAVEHRMELMTTDHREYDRLVMQIDALALKHFPDSQTYAVKKVMEDRVAREFPNMDAHWDGYDYLVALSARVQHMRSVDRSLARKLIQIPDLV